MLFSIKSNILLSSILVFLVSIVSLQNGYIRKWDTQKIVSKKNERKFFKECDLPQNDIIWSKMRTRLDEVKKMLLRFHATRRIHYIFWKPISSRRDTFIQNTILYDSCSLTHFYKQFCILHESFVPFSLPPLVWCNEIFDENFLYRVVLLIIFQTNLVRFIIIWSL